MSRTLISRLALVREEYDAARAALGYVFGRWPAVHDQPEFEGQPYSALRTAATNLEATFSRAVKKATRPSGSFRTKL